MHADVSSATTDKIRALCSTISGIKIFSIRFATPSCRRNGSNRLGRTKGQSAFIGASEQRGSSRVAVVSGVEAVD